MAHPLYVAFIWHQHQPSSRSHGKVGMGHGNYQWPWVRLHGSRDYGGLINLLSRYPSLHQTVNLTPCLLAQLQDYAEGTAIDRHLALTLSPLGQLTIEQKVEILQTFFEANPRTQIFPHRRYQELYEQRQREGLNWCVDHWQPQDFGDLLAWHNLIWFDALTVSEDAELQRWYGQRQPFTLGDRQRIISKQRQIIQNIIPLHRLLQEKGQLEIITSPYSHPILPLLADTNIARTIQPNLALPEPRFCWSEDGGKQLQRGKQYYRQIFGRESRGLWPPGLAISPAMAQTVAQSRFEWLCGDESVLAQTLSTTAEKSAWLHHPYRVSTVDGELVMVFRDQQLSDLIRFNYARCSPAQAAQDLVEQLLARRQNHGEINQPRLVTIALEGDGVWNDYENGGFDFLQQFYQQAENLTRQGLLQLVTVSEFLDKFPPTQLLTQEDGAINSLLGSWHQGNFSRWIGEPSQNQAWDYLIDARQTLASHLEATEDNNPEAWQALYGAESSDWFEALGDYNSPKAVGSEEIFRQHLVRLYHSLNENLPGYLQYSLIDNGDRQRPEHLYPRWENLADLIPWQRANNLPIQEGQKFVESLYYGHNSQCLMVRLEFGRTLPELNPDELHFWWYYPQLTHAYAPVAIASLPDQAPLNYYFHHHCRINLHHLQSHHEIAVGYANWQPSPQRPQLVHQGRTLAVIIPMTALPENRPTALHVLILLAHQGEFVANLSGDKLVQWQLD